MDPVTDGPASDATLVQQVLSGDSGAFSELMRKHQPQMMAAAIRMVSSCEDAEDIVQQVFMEVYRHLKDFRGDSRLSTWLYSIVLNRARNHLRSRRRRSTYSLDAPVERGTDSEMAPREFADSLPSHEDVLATQMEVEWLKQQIKTLPVDYRDICSLYYLQDHSLQEIADRLRRPLNTVKVYLHRSRKELHVRRQNLKGAVPSVTRGG